LKLDIQTFRTRDDIYIYNVMERCSLLADLKLTENQPGKPQRIWFSHHLAGQKGEPGFQDNLAKALLQTLQDLINNPRMQLSRDDPQKAVQPASNQQALVDFDFSQIKIRRQPPAPPYPALAKANWIQGTVVLAIIVDPSGKPSRAEALGGPSELLMTAIRYALQWEFEPAKLNGVPVNARFKLTMPFRLREDPYPSSRSGKRPN